MPPFFCDVESSKILSWKSCAWLCWRPGVRFYARPHGGDLRYAASSPPSERFLIKNPGLVLIRRTPAAGLSSAAGSDHDSVTACRFLPPLPSFSALRAAELLPSAPVRLNCRP